MRNCNVIEAEISKLQTELADVKEYECARDSAVHILKNLGWTRSRGQWVKPKATSGSVGMQTFDADKMTHLKAGDFCTSTSNADIWYVRKVEGTDIWCSRVTRIDAMGTVAEIQYHKMNHKNLHVVDPEAHMGYVSNH
ncbi:hypothetical protein [Pectobacterium phage PcCB251]|uniref:Uncharacterized protein n=1 Tax=Pectobacterium phage PcCB251 TaxID=2798045 RepID=A0AAE7P2M0_9CAUD|nr:hypothetical protein [Pectobacterium phage PcCB251]